MKQTPIQRRIELSVTGGLGYNSQTDFSKTYSIYSDGITPDEIKNTDTGLRVHLREISNTKYKLNSKDLEHIFSYSGIMMNVKKMNKFVYSLMTYENQKMINKAYKVEAKKLGRLKTIGRGISRNIFGDGLVSLTDYIESELKES